MGKGSNKSERQEKGAHEKEDQPEAAAAVEMAIDTRSKQGVSEEKMKVSLRNTLQFEPVFREVWF